MHLDLMNECTFPGTEIKRIILMILSDEIWWEGQRDEEDICKKEYSRSERDQLLISVRRPTSQLGDDQFNCSDTPLICKWGAIWLYAAVITSQSMMKLHLKSTGIWSANLRTGRWINLQFHCLTRDHLASHRLREYRTQEYNNFTAITCNSCSNIPCVANTVEPRSAPGVYLFLRGVLLQINIAMTENNLYLSSIYFSSV